MTCIRGKGEKSTDAAQHMQIVITTPDPILPLNQPGSNMHQTPRGFPEFREKIIIISDNDGVAE